MPYGNHSAEEILDMTRYMLRFMEERGVKALLVACNTISCLIDQYRNDMSCPVLSVVEAGAETAASMPVKRVGVISTCFTHSTRCYPDSIEKLAPEKPYGQYRHNGYEDNADAHLKRSVMGREAVVAVTGGRLDFGTWEQIFYYEFDGRREKHVLVKIIGE